MSANTLFPLILSLSMANNSENRIDEIYMYLKHKTYPEGYGKNQKRILRKTADTYVIDEG